MTAGRNNAVSFSHHWCTPPKYVCAIRKFFGGTIHLDPCSNDFSIVKAKIEYKLPEIDGLQADWNHPTIYVNPPYGADRERGTTIRDWLRKCAEAHARFGSEILALVPVATNTRHWKLYVWDSATGVAFLYDTRLRFLVNGRDGGKGAPMSCAMVYWGRDYERFAKTFLKFGAVVDVRPVHGKTASRAGQANALENQMNEG
jgi:DNA N-6-adenine-methyltransferase (Dam)